MIFLILGTGVVVRAVRTAAGSCTLVMAASAATPSATVAW